jgi:hypothetical protein
MINRMLAVLLGETPDSLQHTRYTQNARTLFQPLFHWQYYHNYNLKSIANPDDSGDRHMSERLLRLCSRLLEEKQGADGGDKVQSRDVAILLRYSLNYSPLRDHNWYLTFELGPYDWHTPEQFDLLVDYHTDICHDKDYGAIFDTFVILAGLRGIPRTPERQRRYITTAIEFMDPKMRRRVRYAALNAAFSVRTVVASMGCEDETLRERFSHALAAAILPTITPAYEDLFGQSFFSESSRNLYYLRLLCTLAQEPAWRGQLYKNGHFDNCLGIVSALSSRRDDKFGAYAVHVTHIIALADAAGDENPVLNMSIQTYTIWPIVLQAWHFIFGHDVFNSPTEDNWLKLSGVGYLEALPSLVAYAKRRGGNEAETVRLIGLVEWVSKTFVEENQRSQLDLAKLVHDDDRLGVDLTLASKQIREILDAL